MVLLYEERRNRWIFAMEEMDYTHSSRKSWAFLRKLGAAQPSRKVGYVVASDIANLLFKTSNIKPQKCEKTEARKELTELLKLSEEKSALMADFTAEEVQNALKLVKNGNIDLFILFLNYYDYCFDVTCFIYLFTHYSIL